MGGFLLFGLCGLPCTFQFFSLQDLTGFTQWGEYLINELCFAALTIVWITSTLNITRSVFVSGHLKLTIVWNHLYKMNVCLSTWLPLSVSPNYLDHISLLVKGFSIHPHYTYIYLFINYVLLKFYYFPPAQQWVALHTPLGFMQPSLEITALYHASHTVAWDMLVLSHLRLSWESAPCVVVWDWELFLLCFCHVGCGCLYIDRAEVSW